jgi:hypothetical protein
LKNFCSVCSSFINPFTKGSIVKHVVNGKFIEVITASDGTVDAAELRKAAGIPDDRPLIVQLPDGSNRLINANENVPVAPGQTFIDAPAHKRGDWREGNPST